MNRVPIKVSEIKLYPNKVGMTTSIYNETVFKKTRFRFYMFCLFFVSFFLIILKFSGSEDFWKVDEKI